MELREQSAPVHVTWGRHRREARLCSLSTGLGLVTQVRSDHAIFNGGRVRLGARQGSAEEDNKRTNKKGATSDIFNNEK